MIRSKDKKLLISAGDANIAGGYHLLVGQHEIAKFTKDDDWEEEQDANKELIIETFETTQLSNRTPKELLIERDGWEQEANRLKYILDRRKLDLDDNDNGWTVDSSFVLKVVKQIEIHTDDMTSMESVEAVLLALVDLGYLELSVNRIEQLRGLLVKDVIKSMDDDMADKICKSHLEDSPITNTEAPLSFRDNVAVNYEN